MLKNFGMRALDLKTLIINGSPRKNGDTYQLLSELKRYLKGDIIEISAYHDNIKPCIDCRKCWINKGCVIKDDMSKIYDDDFNVVVIASPIYMSNLTGPLVSLASRFQAYYAAERFINNEIKISNKDAVLIIVGGGDGKPDQAVESAKWMFKKMKAVLSDENKVYSLCTDELPAENDSTALERIKEIAFRLNQKYSS